MTSNGRFAATTALHPSHYIPFALHHLHQSYRNMSSTSSTSPSPSGSSSTLSTDTGNTRSEVLRSTLSELTPSFNKLASEVNTALQMNKQLSTDHDSLWPRPPVDSYYYPHHVSLASRLSSSIRSTLNRSARSRSKTTFRADAENLSEIATALQATIPDIISTLASSARQYHEGDRIKTDMLQWRSDHARFYGDQNFASRLSLHDAVEGSLNHVTANLEKILDNLGKVSSQLNPDQITARDSAASDDQVPGDIETVQRLLDACEGTVPLLEEQSEILTKFLSQAGGKDANALREPQRRPSRPDSFIFK